MPAFQVLDECTQLLIISLKFCHDVGVLCAEEDHVLVVVISALGRQLDGGPQKTIGVTVLVAPIVDQSHVDFLQLDTPESKAS